MAHRGCLGGGCCFCEGVFVIVVGELLISGCCVMAVSGAVGGGVGDCRKFWLWRESGGVGVDDD